MTNDKLRYSIVLNGNYSYKKSERSDFIKYSLVNCH